MGIAYIGLGSNQGDSEAYLAAAVASMDALPGVQVQAVSSLYHSEPQEMPDQPWFLNQVVALNVDDKVKAPSLLLELGRIEIAQGRERQMRYGARTLDLDILLFRDEVWDEVFLQIPHPAMTKRAFVLIPLLEISPDLSLPCGKKLAPVLAALPHRVEGSKIYQ